MHSRLWAGLLLAALIPASALLAQGPRSRTGGAILLPEPPPPQRPSHGPTSGDLDRNLRPEDAVNDRLGPARLRKGQLDQLADKDTQAAIQELARRLLKDEKLLRSLQEKYTRDDLEQLLGKVGRGQGIGEDPELRRLLRQAMRSAGVSDEDRQKMQSWSDLLGQKGVPEPPDDSAAGAARPGDGAAAAPAGGMMPPSGMSPQPARPPVPALPKREDPAQEWLKKYLDRTVTNLDRWRESPTARSWTNLFKGMGDRLQKNPIATPALAERAGRLTRYLPRFNRLLPSFRPPRIPEPYLPRLPSFGGMPRAGMPSSSSFVTPGKALLWVVVLAVVAVLLWRAGGLVERARTARAAAWRLGPWPVRPEAVATRGELVRAFEHLALLCLGREARTRHHLDLAGQIGGQPALDQERRQEAAWDLARLYEQARYAPEDEPLAAEDLHRARRELCYLAGETAA